MTNKKEKLSIISKVLKSFTKKKATKDWIEPDDKRYTKIVDKYSKELSKHWQKTRDSYIKKITTKSLEIDEEVEQYDNPQYDSSTYIDDALAILALAFGQGVIVGYEEIANRGITVDIPDNPNDFFNQAKESYNYAHAALSYEQSQMDEVFARYNKTETAKDDISKWFDSNEYRLTDLMVGGVVWYSINYGFTKAVIETQESGSDLFLYWLTEKDKSVCDDCKALEDANPYTNDNPLKTLPGGGKTICGSRCRCVIDTKERE